MTKERLEELIKQGTTIYYLYENSCVKTIDLSYGISKFKIGKNYVERKIIGTGFTERYITNKFFETKEQAEWHAKTYAERTERFEPPMWEDIERYYGFSFYGEIIDKLYHRAEYRFFVDKSGAITIFNIAVVSPFRDIYSAYATKENYEKACEIVRDLFGGKNVNE